MFEIQRINGVIEDDMSLQDSDNDNSPKLTITKIQRHEGERSIKKGTGRPLDIGLDSEWCPVETTNTHGLVVHERNRILSYQIYVINDENEHLGKVYYPVAEDKRYEMGEFISLVILDCIRAELITDVPSEVNIYCHFMRADVASFESFWGVKTRFSGQSGSVSGRITTYGEEPDDDKRAPLPTLVLKDASGEPYRCAINFIDTLYLTPNKTSLQKMGEMLELPKYELPTGFSKDRMDVLLTQNREAFEAYALRDAEIAVKYALKVKDFLTTRFGIKNLPPSLGATAVRYFLNLLDRDGLDYWHTFGMTERSTEIWNTKTGKVVTKKNFHPTPARQFCEGLATSCYHGGRNETFMIGPSRIADWFDWDLKGAYTTGLCDLLIPDYTQIRMASSPHDYIGHVMGFAYIRFKFPETTRFPCLVVRSDRYGLRFPLEGYSYATAPEIELALQMGADIIIQHGVIVPWMEGSKPLFENFTRRIQTMRTEYRKKSLEEVMIKEIGNSLYGKTAQGLSEQTAFDVKTGLSKTLSPSKVTNPYMAAHTTGLIRGVIGELLNRIPAHRTVISVTTDGFLTDATEEELDLSGPLCRRYQALCNALHGTADESAPMLELKHHVRQIVSIKTRGQCTSETGRTEPVLAKAGVKSHGTTVEQNEQILKLYLEREPDTKTDASHLISLREQWLSERDLVEIRKSVRLSYEFDQKRQLINPCMTSVRDRAHLTCDSIPWRTEAQADLARARFDGWREDYCLKTLEDWESWEDYFESSIAVQGTKLRVTDEGSEGILVRILLRAMTQKKWFTHNLLHREIAELFTLAGYPTTVDTCKNNRKGLLLEHVVPVTNRVLRLLARLRQQLPQIPLEPLFAPERLDEVRRRLLAIE